MWWLTCPLEVWQVYYKSDYLRRKNCQGVCVWHVFIKTGQKEFLGQNKGCHSHNKWYHTVSPGQSVPRYSENISNRDARNVHICIFVYFQEKKNLNLL